MVGRQRTIRNDLWMSHRKQNRLKKTLQWTQNTLSFVYCAHEQLSSLGNNGMNNTFSLRIYRYRYSRMVAACCSFLSGGRSNVESKLLSLTIAIADQCRWQSCESADDTWKKSSVWHVQCSVQCAMCRAIDVIHPPSNEDNYKWILIWLLSPEMMPDVLWICCIICSGNTSYVR